MINHAGRCRGWWIHRRLGARSTDATDLTTGREQHGERRQQQNQCVMNPMHKTP
jgi:hypothetical protein